jgi:phosphinothricin acetyltransferase
MPDSTVTVRDATRSDVGAIAAIYDHYVLTSQATFEIDPVGSEGIAGRMSAVADDGFPWLVAEVERVVVGYAYASLFRPRAAYRHTVETTVYLAPEATRRGIGRTLMEELLHRLSGLDVHRAIATIALPNEGSVGLHEALGYVAAGRLSEVGHKFDEWIDVGYWIRSFPRTVEP